MNFHGYESKQTKREKRNALILKRKAVRFAKNQKNLIFLLTNQYKQTNMKKVIYFATVAVLTLSMVSCGGTSESDLDKLEADMQENSESIMNEIENQVEENVNSTIETGTELMEDAKEKGAEMVEEGKDIVETAKEKGAEMIEESQEKGAEMIKDIKM